MESLAESTVALVLRAVGWIVYWLFSVGLWFLGGRFIVGIFIAALKSSAKRHYAGARRMAITSYFGSPSAKEQIAADLAEHPLDLTVRKEILWE